MLEQGEGRVWNGKHVCQECSYFGCLWRKANWIKEGKIKGIILLHSQLISTNQFTLDLFRIWKYYGPLWNKIYYSGFQTDLTVFSVSRGNSENLVRHPILIKCPAQFWKFRRLWLGQVSFGEAFEYSLRLNPHSRQWCEYFPAFLSF